MVEGSLQAVRARLKAHFPNKPIYVGPVVSGFSQPSFYVRMGEGSYDDLSLSQYAGFLIWEIVYYPQEDTTGQIDPFDLHGTANAMLHLWKSSVSLTGPDGSGFDIIEVKSVRQEDKFVMKIMLEAQMKRAREQFEIARTVEIKS